METMNPVIASRIYPAGQVSPGPAQTGSGHGPVGQILPTEQQIAHFLGSQGGCAGWLRLSLTQKRTAVYASGTVLQATTLNPFIRGGADPRFFPIENNSNQHVNADAFIHAVDAYCLKLAVQATNAPHPSKTLVLPKATYRPAGQATTPSTYSPWLAGAIGVAIGAVGMHFYMKQ